MQDALLGYISTLTIADIASFPKKGRHAPPTERAIRQVTQDRLAFAGQHLATADQLLLDAHFRSSISRHYYAMYHAARAITFAAWQGDDHQQHSVIAGKLPNDLPDQAARAAELTYARSLRNEADYDIYPTRELVWESDARDLATVAAKFVRECEDFAVGKDYVL